MVLCFQVSNDGLIARRALSYCDANLCVEGQIHINARPEFDEAHVLVDVTFFIYLSISYDAACYGSSNLTHKNLASIRSLNYDGRALVLH